MKIRVLKHEANLAECGQRWLWRERGVYRNSAVELWRLVKQDAIRIANSMPNNMVVSKINWHTFSKVGANVARALS